MQSKIDISVYTSTLLSFDSSTKRLWDFPKAISGYQISSLLDQVRSIFPEINNKEVFIERNLEALKNQNYDFDILIALGLLITDNQNNIRPTKVCAAALNNIIDPFDLYQICLINFPFPNPIRIPQFQSIDIRMQIRPFLFLLYLLHDEELGKFLYKKEFAMPVVYGNNLTCLNICKERIMEYRLKRKWVLTKTYREEWYNLEPEASPIKLLTHINDRAAIFQNILLESKLGILSIDDKVIFNKDYEKFYQKAISNKQFFIEFSDSNDFQQVREELLYSYSNELFHQNIPIEIIDLTSFKTPEASVQVENSAGMTVSNIQNMDFLASPDSNQSNHLLSEFDNQIIEDNLSIIERESNSEDILVHTIFGLPESHLNMPVTILEGFGIRISSIEQMYRNNQKKIRDLLWCQKNNDFYDHEKEIIEMLHLSLPRIIKKYLNSSYILKSAEMIHMRFLGHSLAEIGKEKCLSRERVRQVEDGIARKFVKVAEYLVDILLKSNSQNWLDLLDLRNFFLDDNFSYGVLLYSLSFGDIYSFSAIFHKIVRRNIYIASEESIVSSIIESVIGYYSKIKDTKLLIEDALKREHLIYLSHSEVIDYATKYNYIVHDDEIINKNIQYSLLGMTLVKNYFPDGIFINNKDDLLKLRSLFTLHYPWIVIPTDDRSLASGCVKHLILWGKGLYQVKEKIIYEKELMNSIMDYIFSNSQESIYYFTLFETFCGRLRNETNISNEFGLHGILRSLYSKDFDFHKSQVTRKGHNRETLEEKIKKIVFSNSGKPVPIHDLCTEIPGVSKAMINVAISIKSKVIRWADDTVFHTDFLHMENSVLDRIKSIIDQEICLNSGFTSMYSLFNACNQTLKTEFEKLYINTPIELFNFSQVAFYQEYKFHRPNIFGMNETDLSIASILERNFTDLTISIGKMKKFAERFGWNNMTLTIALIEFGKRKYVRISEDDYLIKDEFVEMQKYLPEICNKIDSYFKYSDFLLSSAIVAYDDFPQFGYEWNSYLLESFLNLDSSGYKVLPVDNKNRVSYFYLIIRKATTFNTYDELVVYMLRKQTMIEFDEQSLRNFLLNSGLTESSVPFELKNSKLINFVDGTYIIENYNK